jgi:hypothetical protein
MLYNKQYVKSFTFYEHWGGRNMKSPVNWKKIRNLKYIRRTRRYLRKNKKIAITIASVFALGIALMLIVAKGNHYTIPTLYLSTEYNGSTQATIGGYEWRSGFKHITTGDMQATDMEYTTDQILTAEKETQITISSKAFTGDNSYPFKPVSFEMFDSNGIKTELKPGDYTVNNGDILIKTPITNGSYTYDLDLQYKKGTVSYGFKVTVTDIGSRASILYSNKTDSFEDGVKVLAIINELGLTDSNTGLSYTGYNVNTAAGTNNIIIKLNTNTAIGDFYENSDNQTLFQKSAILMFGLIGNADLIKFTISSGASSYDIHFTRQEADFYMQKAVAVLAKNEKAFTAMYTNLNISMVVTPYYLQAEMKGLELYVWKNKTLTQNSDTYFTLLIGTNRIKTESEIYDLKVAVKGIDALNAMLARYSTETYLSIYQMNKTDFTKAQMTAIAGEIKMPAKNVSKSIGLWEKADIITVKGTFPTENHNYYFSFDGKEFTPDTDFMFMADNVSNLNKSTYFDVEAVCFYARSLSSLTDAQIQKILLYDKKITVGEKDYINLPDLIKLGVNVTVGWQFNYGTPVTFYTITK